MISPTKDNLFTCNNDFKQIYKGEFLTCLCVPANMNKYLIDDLDLFNRPKKKTVDLDTHLFLSSVIMSIYLIPSRLSVYQKQSKSSKSDIKGCGKACTTPTSRLCKPRLRSLGLSTNLASCIFEWIKYGGFLNGD